ncbi:MAG: hypothetical protein E3J60_01185 [Dehalococcoidia bacterium]|nr:MAG: hypothetical protein E3J60_01185 [Dehalococcoidia bacterium]
MGKDRLNRKEFFALPVKERRKLLSKQANNPALISYYKAMYKPEPSDMPMDGHATMIEPKPKQDKIERVKEIVLEIRQYLCSTEFAPEPFTKPVDVKVLTEDFPSKICQLFELKPDFIPCQHCGMLILRNKLRCPTCDQVRPFEPKLDQSRLLTKEDLINYHREKFVDMYKGNDTTWCNVREHGIEDTFDNHYNQLNREAQDALTASIMDKLCADEKAEFGLSVNEAAVALCDARIEARDIQWVQFYMKEKSMMLEIPPKDYDYKATCTSKEKEE